MGWGRSWMGGDMGAARAYGVPIQIQWHATISG